MDSFIQNLATNALYQQQNNSTRAIASELINNPTKDPVVAAKEFEAMFVAQMLQHMFSQIPTDGIFGGGHAEETWRSMLVEEYGQIIAKSGGIGVAEQLQRELLALQEV